jgi:tRNA nucleotidyltransferase (CCA-adding enzyme)
VGSADRRVLRSVRRPRRSRAALLRVVDPQTFGDDSLRVLRGVQFARGSTSTLEPSTRALCRGSRSTICRPSGSGASSRSCCSPPRPSIGFAVGDGARRDREAVFPSCRRSPDVRRNRSGIPEGDVWVHNLQVIDRARTRIDDLPRPQQLAVMLGAVCHDLGKPATTQFIDGRIRSLDHEEQGVPAGQRLLESPQRQRLRRLRRPQAGAGHHRAASQAGVVVQGARRGRRRRVPPAGAQGRPRAAGAGREIGLRGPRAGQFDCTAMDWFLERARALGVEHRPPAPILLGRHLLALGVQAGPRWGDPEGVYEQQMDGTVSNLDEAIARPRSCYLIALRRLARSR